MTICLLSFAFMRTESVSGVIDQVYSTYLLSELTTSLVTTKWYLHFNFTQFFNFYFHHKIKIRRHLMMFVSKCNSILRFWIYKTAFLIASQFIFSLCSFAWRLLKKPFKYSFSSLLFFKRPCCIFNRYLHAWNFFPLFFMYVCEYYILFYASSLNALWTWTRNGTQQWFYFFLCMLSGSVSLKRD